jgi:hypothetical protein
VIGPDAIPFERLVAAGAIVLAMTGAAAALIGSNAVKRLVGLTLAGLGALVPLALWAPQAVTAGAAILFVEIAIGAAIVVRLQESYGSSETREIDAADAASEPPDRRA